MRATEPNPLLRVVLPTTPSIDSFYTRMGNCCACLESAGAVDGSSVEMKKQRGGEGGGAGGGGKMAPSLTVSRRMSAPSVAIDGEMVVSCVSCVLFRFLSFDRES